MRKVQNKLNTRRGVAFCFKIAGIIASICENYLAQFQRGGSGKKSNDHFTFPSPTCSIQYLDFFSNLIMLFLNIKKQFYFIFRTFNVIYLSEISDHCQTKCSRTL